MLKLLAMGILGVGLTCNSLKADENLFGREGSGRPTNTLVGALFGAATGAAVGQATGGKDGWWIGTLVGSALGGTVGNTIPVRERSSSHYISRGYRPRYARSYTSYRSERYCKPVVYRPRTVTHEVIVEKPVVVEPSPVVIEPEITPYGFIRSDGTIKSPWSDFSMSVGGLSSGQTVYDGLTGKAFRIP